MKIINPRKIRPKLLNNSHLNTILPVYLGQSIKTNYTRERITTTDNDFIDFDWVNKDLTDAPTIVLFHGTEGNSQSHYAKRIMAYLEREGIRGVVPHFRGCSGELNRRPRFYHAGDTPDMVWMLEQVKKTTTQPIFAAGVSLGGNTLLKFLGEEPDQKLIKAAIAISVPYDLTKCIPALDNGLVNKHIYVKHFLNTLIPKVEQYVEAFNLPIIDPNKKINTLDEFNNTYTCQFFNFKDAEDYYRKTSCIHYLKNIKTPTLILQARNDPMIPVESWPDKSMLSPAIRFVATNTGGHAGFIQESTNFEEAMFRLPKFMLQFYKQFTTCKSVSLNQFNDYESQFMEENQA